MSAAKLTTDEKPETLPTIWNIPDELWSILQPLLDEHDPPAWTGRKRVDARKAFDGIIYRMRTGCQWNHLPKEFGDDSSVHRTLQRWESIRFFDILWAKLLEHSQELQGVNWEWQAADCMLGKARGVPKKGRTKSALAPIPPIEASPAPRRACSSKQVAAR